MYTLLLLFSSITMLLFFSCDITNTLWSYIYQAHIGLIILKDKGTFNKGHFSVFVYSFLLLFKYIYIYFFKFLFAFLLNFINPNKRIMVTQKGKSKTMECEHNTNTNPIHICFVLFLIKFINFFTFSSPPLCCML